MVKVSRKKNESFDAMLRRFRTHTVRRGTINEVREKRFRTPVKSRNMRRNSALVRNKMAAKFQYLRKTGQLEPEMTRDGQKQQRRG